MLLTGWTGPGRRPRRGRCPSISDDAQLEDGDTYALALPHLHALILRLLEIFKFLTVVSFVDTSAFPLLLENAFRMSSTNPAALWCRASGSEFVAFLSTSKRRPVHTSPDSVRGSLVIGVQVNSHGASHEMRKYVVFAKV